jgi:hypothetical protein
VPREEGAARGEAASARVQVVIVDAEAAHLDVVREDVDDASGERDPVASMHHDLLRGGGEQARRGSSSPQQRGLRALKLMAAVESMTLAWACNGSD